MTIETLNLKDIKPTKNLRRLAGKAIFDYSMIQENDRILVGLSGGKDSFSLLLTLLDLQKRAPLKFEIGAVTIDPQSDAFDPSSLKEIIPQLEIPYFYESFGIVEEAKRVLTKDNDSFCAFCSRMRRGLMYKVARQNGYNVLALAQHQDDLAETLLMNLFHGGKLRTMQGNYTIDAGDLRVIRPFMYVRERQTRDFAERQQLPIIPENCPACFGKPTERWHMKMLLADLEKTNPVLFGSLQSAMKPLTKTHFVG